MKKLISLLSVLTITGASAPTLIAASPYQKQNLENLTINKRQIKPNKSSTLPPLIKEVKKF